MKYAQQLRSVEKSEKIEPDKYKKRDRERERKKEQERLMRE